MPAEKNKNVLILIPPSEEKKEGGKYDPLENAGIISDAARIMTERLRKYRGNWERLLSLKGQVLEKAIEANKSILASPTLPAVERYTGVMYEGIDYAGLEEPARKFFQEHVRIVSSVFGLLKPNDHIPDYRMKMEKLNAAQFWNPIISKELEGYYVIDLLPPIYRKAVTYENGIAVDFVIVKDDEEIPAGNSGKYIQGRFVRFLCQNKVDDPKHFKNFNEDGYQWDWLVFLKRIR